MAADPCSGLRPKPTQRDLHSVRAFIKGRCWEVTLPPGGHCSNCLPKRACPRRTQEQTLNETRSMVLGPQKEPSDHGAERLDHRVSLLQDTNSTEGGNPPRSSDGTQRQRGQLGDTTSVPGGGRLDVREGAGGQMDRSGHQASGECVSGGRGMSVGAIGRAGLLI